MFHDDFNQGLNIRATNVLIGVIFGVIVAIIGIAGLLVFMVLRFLL